MKWTAVPGLEGCKWETEEGYTLTRFSDNRYASSIQYSVTRPGEGNPFHYTRDKTEVNRMVRADMEAKHANTGN